MFFTVLAVGATLAAPPLQSRFSLSSAKPSTACPTTGAIEASLPGAGPSIDRKDARGGGLQDMVHMPTVVLMSTLNRTINGCNAPLIRGVLFNGNTVITTRPLTDPLPKVAPKP
jgi:hypothetical protein